MALEAGELDFIREAVRETVESSLEKLAQMVAKQFVEIRSDIQDIQDAVRKVGTHQARVEANLSEVGHICEQLKRRLSAIHDGLGTANHVLQERESSFRLDSLEREIAQLRSRLAAV